MIINDIVEYKCASCILPGVQLTVLCYGGICGKAVGLCRGTSGSAKKIYEEKISYIGDLDPFWDLLESV